MRPTRGFASQPITLIASAAYTATQASADLDGIPDASFLLLHPDAPDRANVSENLV